MGVRNCRDIGDNLQRIVMRLMENRNLVKLLYYTDKDPLSHDFSEIVGEGQKYKTYSEFCQNEIFEKLIKIVPRVGPKETSNSILALQITGGHRSLDNGEFKELSMIVESFVPMTQWIIKNESLRPFLILGEVQESLCGKTVNGLGKLDGGDFDVNFLTDEISCYEQEFSLISYD